MRLHTFFAWFAVLLLATLAHAGSPQFEFVRKIENPDPDQLDDFGRRLIATDDRLIVGAPNDDRGDYQSGSAYLFDLSGELVASLANPEPAQFANFGGQGLAASGSTLLIGARSDFGANAAGAAYFYDLQTGEYLDTIRRPETVQPVNFADNAATTSEGFLISDYTESAGFKASGTIWRFSEHGELLGSISNPNPASVSGLGYGGLAAIDSSTLFVSGGVRQELRESGQVPPGTINSWIMSLDGNVLHEIGNPTGDFGSAFGQDAAVVQDRLIVTAHNEDLDGGESKNRGAVYLYDLEGTLLKSIRNPYPAAGAFFGESVARVGDDLFAVGSANSSGGEQGAGAVYVYDLEGELVQAIGNPEPTKNAFFGTDVAYSQGNLYVGADWALTVNSGNLVRAGAVYQFQLVFPPLTADFNGDGVVDLNDFVILKDHFGLAEAKPEQGDANGDGTVDLADFNLLKKEFGSVAQAVPEPAGWVLVACGVTAVGRIRLLGPLLIVS